LAHFDSLMSHVSIFENLGGYSKIDCCFSGFFIFFS
jgi:hypothetical protein